VIHVEAAQTPVRWPLQFSGIVAAFAVLLGAVVLIGWWFGILRVVRPIPGLPGMVPNTAVYAILLGTSLLVLRRPPIPAAHRSVADVSAFVVIGLAAGTLVESLSARNLWFDHIFFIFGTPVQAGFPPGRSAPGTAAAFALLGLAILTLDARPSRSALHEFFPIGAAMIALLALAGYVYGATSLYETTIPQTGMAPHTVALVLGLSAGVLCVRPERPLIALVTSRRPGGFVVRRLMVGAASIPALGFLVMLGLRGSLYGQPFAAALLAVAAMTIAVGLVLWTGRALDRVDAARTASERALAEREERLRDLIEQASDGVFITDLDGRYIEVNAAGCAMLGCRREDVVGKNIMDFLPASDRPRLLVARAALLRGEPQVDEWTLQRQDGTFLPVEVSAKILPDGRWQALVRDISSRKDMERASAAVAEAVNAGPEASVRAVLHTIALEARIVTDAEYVAVALDGHVDRPPSQWVSLGSDASDGPTTGPPPWSIDLLRLVASRNQVVRMASIGGHPGLPELPPDLPKVTSFLGAPIRSRGRTVGNLCLVNKRGDAAFTFADERAIGRLAARAGTTIETARLYEAEGLQRARLEAMIDQMPDGVILADATGATHSENRSMQVFAKETGQRDPWGHLLRYDLREPDGQQVPPDDQPQVRALMDGSTTKGRELALCDPDGRLVPMLVSAAPVLDAQGNRSGAVTIFRDISKLKQLERLHEEWSSVVAHDLRQRVGVIMIDAAGLARMFDSRRIEDGARIVERIRRSTTRLNTMIDDLLDVSRIEARRLALDRAEMDLASLLDDAVDRLSLLAPGHQIQFHAQTRPAPVFIDPARIEQVLDNLISNAAKYGEPGAPITIRLEPFHAEFAVAVASRGPGIAPGDLPTIFDRFTRSAVNSSTTGLGLGLYICKGLVEAHGGRIWAESIPDETTTFHFTIPALRRGRAAAGHDVPHRIAS
jgi:PAS domain S-box-containing protein